MSIGLLARKPFKPSMWVIVPILRLFLMIAWEMVLSLFPLVGFYFLDKVDTLIEDK
jgi:hypothetical protein